MRISALALFALLLIAPATAQNETMEDCPEGQHMVGGSCAEDTMMGASGGDGTNFMPFVVLIAFAAASFLLAKYGP